jgi:predicted amidohydrolase YtcJ
MKQTVHMSVKKMLSCIVVLSVIIAMGMLASCSSNDNPSNGGSTSEKADLVVYGKIFTSDDNKVVEAFAVKDGKYIYVGDKTGAEAYIEAGKTEVVDYTGKGLVMPGCGNGHAHYSMANAIKLVGATVGLEDNASKFLTEIVPAAVKQARDAGAKSIFGFGWNVHVFESNMPTRQQLDAICSDIPMYFSDNEGHKGLANTALLVKAGIMKADGTVLKKDGDILGGEIVMGTDGTPTGYLKEQAGTYARSFLDNESLFSLDIASDILPKIEQQLLSEGYTMYLDGWGSYFFNTNFYQAAQQLDNAGGMHFVLGLSYEIESWMNIDEALAKAADAKRFASTRVKPNWIKLFMDGTVETGTGFVDPLYPDGHQGLPNWSEEQLTDMTRVANENGVTMHVHVMGNKGVTRIVNAFVNGGKDEMRNTLVHVRNIDEADYKRMADHHIYVTSGVLWHYGPDGLAEYMREHGIVPAGQEDKSYPMKSYFDNGIIVTTHSDYPALSGSPDDPFGIMEIAVTGMLTGVNGKPYWTEELVTREQAIAAMTINIAKQMFIEDERGSIKTGKYADFLLVTKDVLSCPENEIHEAKPAATYFEGKKVFSMND